MEIGYLGRYKTLGSDGLFLTLYKDGMELVEELQF